MRWSKLAAMAVMASVALCVASGADGGIFCGRIAQRRSERLQRRQACHSAVHAMHSVRVESYSVGCSGASSGCSGASQPVSYAPRVEHVSEIVPAHQVVSYAPFSGYGQRSSCRMVNGQMQCGF